MIQFNFTGDPYPSFEEQKSAKEFFINKLGPFKEEFENSGGSVVFNYRVGSPKLIFDILETQYIKPGIKTPSGITGKEAI